MIPSLPDISASPIAPTSAIAPKELVGNANFPSLLDGFQEPEPSLTLPTGASVTSPAGALKVEYQAKLEDAAGSGTRSLTLPALPQIPSQSAPLAQATGNPIPRGGTALPNGLQDAGQWLTRPSLSRPSLSRPSLSGPSLSGPSEQSSPPSAKALLTNGQDLEPITVGRDLSRARQAIPSIATNDLARSDLNGPATGIPLPNEEQAESSQDVSLPGLINLSGSLGGKTSPPPVLESPTIPAATQTAQPKTGQSEAAQPQQAVLAKPVVEAQALAEVSRAEISRATRADVRPTKGVQAEPLQPLTFASSSAQPRPITAPELPSVPQLQTALIAEPSTRDTSAPLQPDPVSTKAAVEGEPKSAIAGEPLAPVDKGLAKNSSERVLADRAAQPEPTIAASPANTKDITAQRANTRANAETAVPTQAVKAAKEAAPIAADAQPEAKPVADKTSDTRVVPAQIQSVIATTQASRLARVEAPLAKISPRSEAPAKADLASGSAPLPAPAVTTTVQPIAASLGDALADLETARAPSPAAFAPPNGLPSPASASVDATALQQSAAPPQPSATAIAPQPSTPAPITDANSAFRLSPQLESTIEQLTATRSEAQANRPELTVRHQEFGAVTMRLDASNGDLRATLSARDPGFVPAIQTALAERGVAASSEASGSAPQRGNEQSGSHSSSQGSAQQGQGHAQGQAWNSGGAYGSSTGSGQGTSQPYAGQTENRDKESGSDQGERKLGLGDGSTGEGEIFA